MDSSVPRWARRTELWAYFALGYASSPDGTSGGLQTYDSGPINKVVWPSQQAYVYLHVGGTSISVYGVTVEYHRNL